MTDPATNMSYGNELNALGNARSIVHGAMATINRYGDPEILALFDAWWSTPMAYKDAQVDPSKWDAVVSGTGDPILYAAWTSHNIGPLATHLADKTGLTLAVSTEETPPTALWVATLRPTRAGDSEIVALGFTNTFGDLLDLAEHNAPPVLVTLASLGVFELKVAWPLGHAHDGDNNRVAAP